MTRRKVSIAQPFRVWARMNHRPTGLGTLIFAALKHLLAQAALTVSGLRVGGNLDSGTRNACSIGWSPDTVSKTPRIRSVGSLSTAEPSHVQKPPHTFRRVAPPNLATKEKKLFPTRDPHTQ